MLSKNTYLSPVRSVPDNTPAFDDAVVSSYWHADQTQATLLAVDVRGYMKPSVVIAKKTRPSGKGVSTVAQTLALFVTYCQFMH